MEANPNQGELFLHSKDSSLQRSLAVELEQIRRDHAGEIPKTKPAERIADWLSVVEQTHTGHPDDPRVLERIKISYHKDYVVNPAEIPESVFELEARIAREQGHGNIPITPQYRQEKAAEIVSNQEESLDRWVDYLTSDDAPYPKWVKYWAVTAVTTMGKFEKSVDSAGHESARFAKRTADTVAPFPPLNPRALALSIGAIEAKVAEKALSKTERNGVENTSTRLTDSEFKQLLSGESFSKLYTQFLIEMPAYSADGMRETRGRWVKYEQGADAQPLVDSLAGHPLEWCTANLDTAKSQLEGGDFFVYYSLDQNNAANIPRVAIRMDQDQIAEVRGIAPDQNLDPFINEVVEAKMAEFPEGASYQQRVEDMKRVTEIEDSRSSGRDFTASDLRFLYEVDHQIEGFGYERDPRIAELLDGRDTRTDLSMILGYPSDQISLKSKEALASTPTRPIIYHHGAIDLSSLTSADGLTLPRTVRGYLRLDGLTSANGLRLPESLGGDLVLDNLISAAGLTMPESVGGDLALMKLTSADGLKLPGLVGGDLYLTKLTSIDDLKLPQSVGGDLNLSSLTSADYLMLPDSVGGYLSLNSLQSVDDLKLPQSVGGDLYLSNLTSADGLTLPQSVGGNLFLRELTSAAGLNLPESIGGNLVLENITSADGLRLPQSIGGGLYINHLTSADGFRLPDSVSGDLNLNGLASADGLTLPDSVGGNLGLASLASADGLKLPESVSGDLNLNGVVSADGLTLPDSVGGDLYLSSLASTDGLRLPHSVGGVIMSEGLSLEDVTKLKQQYPNHDISKEYN